MTLKLLLSTVLCIVGAFLAVNFRFNKKNNKIDLNEIIITLEKVLKTIGIKNL